MLGGCVDTNEGVVVKSTGDGILASFESPSRAIAAAIEMQQDAARYSERPDAIGVVSIRIGLSVGEVTWIDDDCSGTPVVEAARLEAAAQPGQILCSDLVKMMTHGRGGHEFSAVGELELKGLGYPLPTSEVVWEREADAAPSDLPPELAVVIDQGFVGRGGEHGAILRRMDNTGDDHPVLTWLLGEPGIGKTRLAAEVAASAASEGARVLFGRCSEDLTVPHQPFIEILRAEMSGVTDGQLAETFATTGSELSRLAPELGRRVPTLDAPTTNSTAELEEYRLFEAVRQWLSDQADERPLLVILDDMHWAAPPTIQLVAHLASTAGSGSLHLLATARSTRPDENEQLTALIDKLSRTRRSVVYQLDGLTEAEIAAMVGEGRLAKEIDEASGGNPLLISALMEAQSRGEAATTDLAGTIRARLSSLSSDAQDALTLASICELDFDSRVLANALSLGDDEMLDRLDVGADARLIAEIALDTWRFEHGLVRAALRDEIRPSRRARMHHRIAAAIEDVFESRLDEHTSELAHHYYEAAGGGASSKAATYLALAGETAAAMLALDEAEANYERAIEVSEDERRRSELLLALGSVRRRAGRNVPATAAFHDAFTSASEARHRRQMVLAAIEYEDTVWRSGVSNVSPLELLEKALRPDDGESDVLAELADEELQVRATAAVGRAECFTGEVNAGADRLRGAVEIARRTGQRAALGQALAAYCIGDIRPGSTAEVEKAGDELIELAADLGDEELAAQAHQFQLRDLIVQGAVGRYRHLLPTFLELTDELRSAFFRYVAHQHVALLAFQDGRLDDAITEAERAVEIAEELPGEDPSGVFGIRMFAIRREQDGLAVVGPLLARMLERQEGSMWRPGLALLHAAIGNDDQARAVLDDLAADDFAAVAQDAIYPLTLGFLAETCWLVGASSHVDHLKAALSEYAGLSLVGGSFIISLGSAERYVGGLSALEGDAATAHDLLMAALDANRSLESPLWEGHTALDLADLAATRSHHADAKAFASRAHDLGQRHQLPRVVRRATTLLDHLS